MSDNKFENLLNDLGEEVCKENAEKNVGENDQFSNYQNIKQNLIKYNLDEKPAEVIEFKHSRWGRKKKFVLAASIVAVLGLSVTAYAAVRQFALKENVKGNGEYELSISSNDESADNTEQTVSMQPVNIKAGYIPQGYVSNEADYTQKYRIYPEDAEEFGGEGITVIGEPVTSQTINMANVTKSEDAVLGNYTAKILTTFSQDGSEGYDIIMFDSEKGYMLTIYSCASTLSLDELKKIAENISYEIVEDADPISVDTKSDEAVVQEPVSILQENIFKTGETKQDIAAGDKDILKELDSADESGQLNAKMKVQYTVNSIKISDTLPDIDTDNGYVSDILNENILDNGTLKSIKQSYAELDPSTQEVNVVTNEYAQKYVLLDISLENTSDTDITDYYYQVFINSLQKDGETYKNIDSPISFNEPVYLSFKDYDGKSSYKMNLAAGETRNIQVLYLADEVYLDSDYLCFNCIGYADGNTCFDNYLKLTDK